MYESAFNNWAKGMKASDLPESQRAIGSLFGEGHNFAGEGGAMYAQHGTGGTRVAIPGNVAGHKGLVQLGTSYFSMPARTVRGDEIIDTTEAAYHEMRSAAQDPVGYRRALRDRFPDKQFSHLYRGGNQRIQALKEASAAILDTSRSTVSTALGPDYTLAFQRSRMVNIMDLAFNVPKSGKYGGQRKLRDLLGQMDELVSIYQRSGGRDLTQKQAWVDAFYHNLVSAVEGSRHAGEAFSISGIKDKLFREQGVASTLRASDITYGVSLSGLGKGYHQFGKLQPFQLDVLKEGGLLTPAASGMAFADESRYVSKLVGFEGVQAGGKYSARFGADTFLSLGTVSKVGSMDLSPSQILADSRSIAGERLYDLTTKGRVMDTVGGGHRRGVNATKSKTILLGGAEGTAISGLEFHSEIADDMKELIRAHQDGTMSVPKGMKRSSAGLYLYEGGAKLIGRTDQYADDIDFFLGKSRPDMVGAPGPDDLKRALVGSGERQSQLEILGYKMSSKGGGAIDVIYEPGRLTGVGSGFSERAMLIHGRRVMQRQSARALKTTTGRSVDQVLRGAEMGIGKELGEDFFTAVMSSWGEISRRNNKQGNLVNFLSGHKLMKGPGGSTYMALTSNEAGFGTNLFNNISKVLGASDSALADLGLSRGDVDFLRQDGNKFALNKKAMEYMWLEGANGPELHMGPRFAGLETAMRAGTVDAMKIGPGAMSMRLHDMIPMINEQMSMAPDGSDLQKAYQGFHAGVKGRILDGRRGRMGSIERGLPGASSELASIYQSYHGTTTPFKGGVLEGIKGSHKVLDYGAWLSGGAKPLSPTQEGLKQMLMGARGFGEGVTAGTVHGIGYGGEVIRLPKAIKVALTDSHVIETSLLPMPTDRFLGSSATEMGSFVSGSGIRGLGLVRKKAMLSALMHEEASTIASGNYSKKFTNAFQEYMGALQAGMSAKEGLIYKNMVGQPAGAFNSVITNWGSIEGSGLTPSEQLMRVGMNPADAKSLLKSAGYNMKGKEVAKILAGTQGAYLNLARYPWHQGSNLGVMKLEISENVARDRIAVSDLFAQIAKGDFDKDMMVGMLLKDQQAALKTIHLHREHVMGSYDKIVRHKEKQQLADIVKRLKSGDLHSGEHFDDLIKKPIADANRMAMHGKMATRLGSAAGGGVYVGPVHMGWARMNALANTVMEKEGASLISSISAVDAELGKQLSALSKDKGFLKLMGTTQETGVYGILKKGAKGFGTEQMSALSALVKYGEGGIDAATTKSTLKAGFQSAADQGLFEMSEVAKHGVKDAGTMADALMPSAGAHEGIGTLAKVRTIMRNLGAPDSSYEVARGYDPTRKGGSLNYFARRVMDTMYAMTGGDTPMTVGSPAAAESFTRMTAQLADEAAEGALDASARAVEATTPAGAPSAIEGMSQGIRGIMQSRWGKRIMIGAGVVLGIGAIDAMLGAEGEDVTAPAFVGGAPLPPKMNFDLPDQQMGMPSAEGFAARARAPARIERPIAQRANYFVSATAGQEADFSYMMGGYQGSVGAPPTRDAVIRDGSHDMDMDYELRRRLRSSF